jgi:hypothetical protein
MNARRAFLAVSFLAVLLVGACSSAAPQRLSSGEGGAPAAAPVVTTDAKSGIPGNVSGTSASQGLPAVADRDLILTASVQMRSDDPWQTADAARAIATGLGGGVLGMSQSLSNERRMANLVMRVPADRFDDAIAALKRLNAEVLSSNVDAKDVTDQLVDLDARLVALRAEEQRYLQLFASAKTVDEMLKVEAGLAQIRQQIEQLAAQQKSTKDRVAFSTITLSVQPTVEPVVVNPPKWDPAHTFGAALAAATMFLRFVADFAIWLLVFSWVPLLALIAVLLATRMRRPSAA